MRNIIVAIQKPNTTNFMGSWYTWLELLNNYEKKNLAAMATPM